MTAALLILSLVIVIGLASRYRYVPVYWSTKPSNYAASIPLLDSLAASESPFATLIFSIPFTNRGFLVRRHDIGFSVQLASGLPIVRHLRRAKFARACAAEGLEMQDRNDDPAAVVPGPSIAAVAKIKALMAFTYGHKAEDALALTLHFYKP